MQNLFLRRSIAYLVDIVCISMLFGFIMAVQVLVYNQLARHYGLPTWLSRSVQDRDLYSNAVGFFVFTAYMSLVPWLYNGQTLGKYFLKIYIQPRGTANGLLFYMKRALCYQLSYLICGIGFLFPWFRRDGRTMHDLLAQSDVLPCSATAPAQSGAELLVYLPHPTAKKSA